MTIPTVDSVTASSGGNTTTGILNYPASGMAAGKLVIMLWSNDGSGDTPTWPSGDLADNVEFNQNNNHGSSATWKEAEAGDNGGSESISISSSEGYGAFCIVINDWDTATPPEFSTPLSSSNDDWESVSLTPSWDASTIDTLWIAWTTYDNSDDIVTAYPFAGNNNAIATAGAAVSGTAFCTDATKTATMTTSELNPGRTDVAGAYQGLIAVRGASAGPAAKSIVMPSRIRTRTFQHLLMR